MDGQERKQPCRRCVEWGKAAQCEFLLSRKRGRRPQERSATPAEQTRSRKKTSRRSRQPVPEQRLACTSTSLAYKETTTTATTTTPSAAAQAMGQSAGSGLSTMLLSMLMDQVRDLRSENRRLMDRVMSLQGQQTVFERQLDALRSEHMSNAMANRTEQRAVGRESNALRVRMPSELFSQPIEPGSDMHLSAIKQVLPFLASYDLSASGLVINDLREPFSAVSINLVGGELQLLYSYLSPGYTQMMGYETYDLVGAPVFSVKRPEDAAEAKKWVHSYLRGPPPQSGVGTVEVTSGVGLCKDGRAMRVHVKHQFFWDSDGRSKWCITTLRQAPPTEDAHQRGFLVLTGAAETLGESRRVANDPDSAPLEDLELDELLLFLRE